MSKSGQEYVAKTQGTNYTLYKMMELLGIPLSEEQAKFQAYLESVYPPDILEDMINSLYPED